MCIITNTKRFYNSIYIVIQAQHKMMKNVRLFSLISPNTQLFITFLKGLIHFIFSLISTLIVLKIGQLSSSYDVCTHTTSSTPSGGAQPLASTFPAPRMTLHRVKSLLSFLSRAITIFVQLSNCNRSFQANRSSPLAAVSYNFGARINCGHHRQELPKIKLR